MAEPKQTFFQKHPGFDAYSLFWFIILVVLVACGRLYTPVLIPAAVVLVYLLIRLLSKKQENRQIENARFLMTVQAVVRWFKNRKKGLRREQKDPQYLYFKCPTCGQPMRVPRGLGKIQISCRSCGSHFETKS